MSRAPLGRWEKAKSVPLEHAPADAHDEVHGAVGGTAKAVARPELAPARWFHLAGIVGDYFFRV